MSLSDIDLSHNFTAEAHFVDAEALYNNAANFRDLLNVALALRICIERLCFEYLVLFTHAQRNLTKAERKAWKPKELIERVLKEQPYFSKMVAFGNAVLDHTDLKRRMVCPDFQWVETTYGQLNDYLHLQSEPLADERKNQLVNIISESLPRLKNYILNRGRIYNLTDHATFIFDKFVAGEIDEGQMKRMVKLSAIPPHMLDPE